jgi:uncharacterized membrane protein
MMDMRKDIVLASILFIVSILLLFDKLTASRPIQIIVEGGEAATIGEERYYTFSDALMLIVCAAIAGISAAYIFLESDTQEERSRGTPQKKGELAAAALRILEGDEAKIFGMIVDAGGEILQKTLVLEGGFDKVKVTRLLDRLEEKGLIVRIKHGMTNKVTLKQEL